MDHPANRHQLRRHLSPEDRMTQPLNEVIPWGCNLDEYLAMFALSDADRGVSILGCADGSASFNAEGTAKGMRIVSLDPIYSHRAEAIRSRIAETADVVASHVRSNMDRYVWNAFADCDQLLAVRLGAMNTFLDDYELGIEQGRYVDGSVTSLPFFDNCYDLALCSHFLFLYGEQNNLATHIKAVSELCRVAEEVRIFPLLDLEGAISKHLAPVEMSVKRNGWRSERVTVPYEFQRGANQMLRIYR
jgi:hypothetical protein